MRDFQLRFLVVIGAQKCGTTSTFEALKTLPGVAPAREKEIGFFNSPEKWALGFQWYLQHWPREAWRKGMWLLEASTAYTAQREVDCEWFVGTRMQELSQRYGTVFKLVYCVRDPVARFISALASAWAQGLYVGTVDEALENHRYWGPSCFAKYVNAYRRAGFEPAIYDATLGQPLKITLDGTTHPITLGQHNITSQKASILWQERWLSRHPGWRAFCQRCLPVAARCRLSSLLARKPAKPMLTDTQRQALLSRILEECGGRDQWGPELPAL